jgi:hypothetical protein
MRRVLFGLLAAGLLTPWLPAQASVFILPLDQQMMISGGPPGSNGQPFVGSFTIALLGPVPRPGPEIPGPGAQFGYDVSATIALSTGGQSSTSVCSATTRCFPGPPGLFLFFGGSIEPNILSFVQSSYRSYYSDNTTPFSMQFGPFDDIEVRVTLSEGFFLEAAPIVTPVPESSTWAMLLIGFGVTASLAVRRTAAMRA